jgi:hypothetical protein
MNARKLFTLVVILTFSAIAAAPAGAGVGTNKARGIYSGGGWTSMSGSVRTGGGRGYNAPATSYVYRAPAIRVAPAPMVATAPTEGRRFSYAPAPAPAASRVPCINGRVAAATPAPTARRFSYAPAPEASVSPAPTYAPRVDSTRPSYSGRSGSGTTIPRFPLLKTDPRKFNTR